MEPFELSLNQVNFEEQTFSESDEFHSFSNLVSYDSDFPEDKSQGFPIRSKRIQQFKVADSFHCSQVNHMARVMDETKLGFGPVHLFSSNKDANPESSEEMKREVTGTDVDETKVSDSFKAFTETVEALALQKSVIGNKNVIPASADEVARVVAATRARLNNVHHASADSLDGSTAILSNSSDVDSTTSAWNDSPKQTLTEFPAITTELSSFASSESSSSDKKTEAQLDTEGREEESRLLAGVKSQNIGSPRTATDVYEGRQKKEEPGNQSDRITLTNVSSSTESPTTSGKKASTGDTVSGNSNSSANSVSNRVYEGKELIRISAKDMSTDTKKSQSSWFWSKSTTPVPSSKQGHARKVHDSSNSEDGHRENLLHDAKVSSSSPMSQSHADVENVNSKTPLLKADTSEETFAPHGLSESIPVTSTKTSHLKEIRKNSATPDHSPEIQGHGKNSLQGNLMVTAQTFEAPGTTSTEPPHDISLHETLNNTMSGDQTRHERTETDSMPQVGIASSPYQRIQMVDRKIEEEHHRSTMSPNKPLVNNDSQIRQPAHEISSLSDHYETRSISRQESVDSAFSGLKDDVQLRLEQILKQKVKLEGQVEVLEAETSVLLKERAELQTRVAALMQELQSREKSRVGLTGDRDALSADLETLRQNRGRLEAVIMDAHKLLEDKDQELKVLENELELAKEASDKQLDRMKNFQTEVKLRDATVTDLKAKITELYVEYQTTNQNRILAYNEVGSLQGELKSMAAAKEWYKDQLQFAQREKAELQAEVTRVKAEMIAQGTSVERLKAEVQRTKRQLVDTEQRSLNEKQMLARHLESIEADMMEREAMFSQMQKERLIAADQTHEERAESESTIVLREELNKSTNDVKRSLGQVTLLQQEQKELVKRLTLSQQSILERDKVIETMEKSAVDLESQLKQTQLELSTRNEEIGRLDHNRSILEMELKSAKDEKDVFDNSLRSLKDDMSIVDKTFRVMKQELLTKQNELDRLRVEIGDRQIKQGMRESQPIEQLYEIPQTLDYSPVHNIVRSLTKYQSSETQTDIEIGNDGGQEREICEGIPDAKPGVLERLEAEKASAEMQLDAKKQLLETMETERQQMAENFLRLEQEVVVLKERTVDLELKLAQSLEEKEKVTFQLEEKIAKIDGSERMTREEQEELIKQKTDNTDLRSKLGDLQRESHKEIAKQKTKVLKLGKQLEMATKEHREACQASSQLIDEQKQRLSILEETNARLEVELTNANQRAALDQDEKVKELHLELKRLAEELDTLRNNKHSVEMELNQVISCYQLEINDHKAKIEQLHADLQNARSYIEERREADIKTENLALELEREKGRLAGFLKSHSTLKEHASLLEVSLANKESSVVQLSSEVEEEVHARDRQIQELTEHIRLLEESLAKEKQNVKDARKQFMTEKGTHIKVRRELEQLSSNHGQVVAEVEQLRKELSQRADDAERTKNDQISLKMELEHLLAEMKSMTLERDRMARELEDKDARDKTLQEHIQSLEWKLSQKAAEMVAAEEKAELIDERRQAEATGLDQSLQATRAELCAVRDELVTVKHEKAELKAKVSQLKQILISIVEQCTKATEAGRAITIQMIMNKEEIEQLLQESTTPSLQSKPLSFLQATLSGLRGEISGLQMQVNEHTSVVQTSSQAWRQLEAQVEDLRQVCKSSAANRAASDKLLKTTEEFSQQLPPLGEIQRALQLPSVGPLVLPGSMVSIVTTATTKTTSSSSKIEIVENQRTEKPI